MRATWSASPHFREILINAGFHTVATPFQDDLVREIRGTLYLLWGGVLFVLLIGAVNITNLVLVRSSARMKELATRHALGAGLVDARPAAADGNDAADGRSAAIGGLVLGYAGA